jgi:uncharacterized membrane protein YkoI
MNILIVVVIVLVGVTGVMAGFILQGQLTTPVAANNSNVTVNNTPSTGTAQVNTSQPEDETSKEEPIITESEAINIAINDCGFDPRAWNFKAYYHEGNHPYWHVAVFNKKTGVIEGGVDIDAMTGAIL